MGTCSEFETASLNAKSESQIQNLNGYSETRSPATSNGQHGARAGLDSHVPITESPNSGREFGSTSNGKCSQDASMLHQAYRSSAEDYAEASFKKAPPSPCAAILHRGTNVTFGGHKPLSRLSHAINSTVETNPTSSLVDTLTAAIFGTINLLLVNHASVEELREPIRRELSAYLHLNSQSSFKAGMSNENGTVNSQTKSIVCSTCKLGMKRPCDLK